MITSNPLPSRRPAFSLTLLPEPILEFGNGGRHPDPKAGLTEHGPFSLSDPVRHPSQIRLGIIGTGETIDLVRRWLERCAQPIERKTPKKGKRDLPNLFPAFCGFNAQSPFHCEFVTTNEWQVKVTRRELDTVLNLSSDMEQFNRTVDLFASKVQFLTTELPHSPKVILCALPNDVVETCGSIGRGVLNVAYQQLPPFLKYVYKKIERDQKRMRGQGNLFAALLEEAKSDTPERIVYGDFRRALKARVMKWGHPIQIVKPSTFKGGSDVEDDATRAWNFCVGMYYKAEGIPWRLAEVEADTCFVGISFYHHLKEHGNFEVHSSIAQVFDGHGGGIVLRGEEFEWNPQEYGRTPHLTEQQAKNLLGVALAKYEAHTHTKPRRVVVHKESTYRDEELRGFQRALTDANISEYDLVALLHPGVRFFREGEYPPLRNTLGSFDEQTHFLYTGGFTPFLDTYPHSHVPKPWRVVKYYGDSSISQICQEILALTKLNWNSARFAVGKPITLLFADSIGEIMDYIPDKDPDPQPLYRFYM